MRILGGRINVRWAECDQEGCIGIRLIDGTKCLAHAGDDEQETALRELSETGIINARGVTISSPLLRKIIDSAPRRPDLPIEPLIYGGWEVTIGGNQRGQSVLRRAEFSQATFQGDAEFAGVIFQGDASFEGATFQDDVFFDLATFQGDTDFSQATFQGDAEFTGVTFRGDTLFGEATFQGNARFDRVSSHGNVKTSFEGATFQDDALFSEAMFEGDITFKRTTFWASAEFDRAIFRRNAEFTGVAFEEARKFGPVLAHRGLDLDEVYFGQPVEIEASTISLCCRRARFERGVQFRLRWARVVLDDTDLSAPSLLTGFPLMPDDTSEACIARAWKRLPGVRISEQPRLLSLQGAKLAGLVLADVDLTDCRFSGAHNLDKLQLEANVRFGLSPARAGWERRQVIAEECAWRAKQTRSNRWTAPSWPGWAGSEPVVLPAGLIAALYRSLRKGREDLKDSSGAADFYYGEMEMRRHAGGRDDRSNNEGRGQVDRAVLTAYWLLSGYSLRAWRALAWLAGLTVGFALAFHMVGFIWAPQPVSY